MSSRVPATERVKRGFTEKLEQLPEKVQRVLKALAEEFDEIILIGSYSRGSWADDSDVDVGIRSCNYEKNQEIGKRYLELYDFKVDALDWNYAINHKGARKLGKDLKLEEIENGWNKRSDTES